MKTTLVEKNSLFSQLILIGKEYKGYFGGNMETSSPPETLKTNGANHMKTEGISPKGKIDQFNGTLETPEKARICKKLNEFQANISSGKEFKKIEPGF